MAAGTPSGEGVGVEGAALEGLTELPPVADTVAVPIRYVPKDTVCEPVPVTEGIDETLDEGVADAVGEVTYDDAEVGGPSKFEGVGEGVKESVPETDEVVDGVAEIVGVNDGVPICVDDTLDVCVALG